MLRVHPTPGSGTTETRPPENTQAPAFLELLSLSREKLWDSKLHPEEKTPDSYLGLGPQDLLAASLTAVLLGGWILFVMRQQQPQVVEKQQETPLTPADSAHISQDAQSLHSGATPKSQKRLRNPSKQAQPLDDPEGELE
ncbi:Serine/threonine-protein kinase/endoribonuclease IRE2 [Saguinus oedipus]|uniref:Serine/threonine-protein kinase/endoribonuclease IRE2 n=1 Tax=Saguinus oedipus TaxID=9490 RepID=A0ABQ9UKW8_SAGOE|nr:Serine/threonine-protein kinase/endoribonuclease IRE2 [Saguinus oedipus]